MKEHLKALIQEMRFNRGWTKSRIVKEVMRNTGMSKTQVSELVEQAIKEY